MSRRSLSMSDSEDLGGFSPTTPHPPSRRATSSKARANGKPNTRTNAEAGPSTKPPKILARKKVSRTRGKPGSEDSDEVQEVVREVELDVKGDAKEQEHVDILEEDGQDVQMLDLPKARKIAPVENGKPTARGKGKGRAPPSKRMETKTIDVDAADRHDEFNDDINDIIQETYQTMGAAFGRRKKERESREIAKLQERLRRSQEQVQLLQEQLEETQRIRETEAEKMLKAIEDQYSAELKSKEALIDGLTSQLAQKDTLTSRGKRSILHMITREAADEEQRNLERDNIRQKELLAQKDQELQTKGARISELEQLEKDLRVELKAEIERSKKMVEKPMRAPRPGPAASDDPKNAQVIRFYEDLTNLLVMNMKHQPGQRPGTDEWTLKCMYTFSEDSLEGDAMQKSINFYLRTTEVEPNEQSIHYTPEDLDKEHPDFVQRLDFLNLPFTFSRKQLSLFLRTLYDKLKEACGDENQVEDDEVQIVE